MKNKILSVILCISLAVSIIACAGFSASAENPRDVEPYAKGDPTGDGKISMMDVTETQRYIAKLVSFDSDEKYAADVNNDEDVTMVDVTDMQKYIANLITFPSDDNENSDTDKPDNSDKVLTINGEQFREGDTVEYIVALKCTGGDITAVNALVEYDTSLLSFEYDEKDDKEIFPVIYEDVTANVVEGEGFYFNSHLVNRDYTGFDFGSKKVLVRLSFTVNELAQSTESEIKCNISELMRYDERGFTDFILDGEILSNDVSVSDSIS